MDSVVCTDPSSHSGVGGYQEAAGWAFLVYHCVRVLYRLHVCDRFVGDSGA